MPARNSIKQYHANGFYHLYNRGVEKRKIFETKKDYAVFLSYLKEYLLPKNEAYLRQTLIKSDLSPKKKDELAKALRMNNFYGEIELLAFCLMPNHFHLLIKQRKSDSMDIFMNSLCTRYTMYFNRRNRRAARVGKLFQGVYKAVLVNSEEYLLHLSRYIHYQAVKRAKRPSSLPKYLGQTDIEWVNSSLILSYFSKTNPGLSYRSFISGADKESFGLVAKLLIE